MLAAIVDVSELHVLGISSVLKDEGYVIVPISDIADLECPGELDLVVTELRTEDDLSAIQARLIDIHAAPASVALLGDAFRPHVMKCASAGLFAIVHHTCRLETLRRAIHAAETGQPFADEHVGSWMLSAPGDRFTNAGLSERERQVAELLLSDRTKDEIAQALFVSPNTIKYHTAHIYSKLGVQSRRGLRFVLGATVMPPRRDERDSPL